MQVDKGAIRFVLSGANIMCPGLTSPGAKMTKVDKDQIVVSFVMYFKAQAKFTTGGMCFSICKLFSRGIADVM